jgi:hypothetical protein
LIIESITKISVSGSEQVLRTLIVLSIEAEYSLMPPTTNDTTASWWPTSEAAGSKQLVAALNLQAKILPSSEARKIIIKWKIRSTRTNQNIRPKQKMGSLLVLQQRVAH